MRDFTSAAMLDLWEHAARLHPVDRALVLLSTAQPSAAWESLARLPIGQRDAQLLALREAAFGPRLPVFTECPQCAQRLEFELTTRDLLRVDTAGNADEREFQAGEWCVRFRLPDSFDLAAIARSPDVDTARRELARRCILALDGGGGTEPGDLPPEVIAALAARIAQADPLADIQLSLDCPACKHNWQVTFDIGSFLWAEINSQAKRLLREVHTLARAYGWREAEILGMSASRRQAYLEMTA